MPVGVKVGSIVDEVGAPSFLNSFFSSVAVLLEHGDPGTRYPLVSCDFYEGHLAARDVNAALQELKLIHAELAGYPPQAVVWDMDDPGKRPPWGNNISRRITSMANYFVSSTGRDLFELLVEAFEYAVEKKLPVDIVEV